MSYTEQLDRIATALEKLSDDSVVEVDAGPPVCPTCGEFDPPVLFPGEDQQEGKLSGYVIQAQCLACNSVMYVVIDSFSMHRELETVKNEIESRAGMADG